MSDLETELRVARALYERRLRTLKRLIHHLETQEKSSSDTSANEVALKVAHEELASAKQLVESTFEKLREEKHPSSKVSTIAQNASAGEKQGDHFEVALNRADPKTRLRLAK